MNEEVSDKNVYEFRVSGRALERLNEFDFIRLEIAGWEFTKLQDVVYDGSNLEFVDRVFRFAAVSEDAAVRCWEEVSGLSCYGSDVKFGLRSEKVFDFRGFHRDARIAFKHVEDVCLEWGVEFLCDAGFSVDDVFVGVNRDGSLESLENFV